MIEVPFDALQNMVLGSEFNPGTTTANALRTRLLAALRTLGISSSWQLISSVTIAAPVANVTFTNLDAYTDILLFSQRVTLAGAAFRGWFVSSDNGASYYNTSGNYKTIDGNGVETNQTSFGVDAASSALARSSAIMIPCWNLSAPKMSALLNRAQTVNSAMTWYIDVAVPMNAATFVATPQNLTGGTVYCFGKPG